MSISATPSRLVAGAMTGTSIDGIDIALASIEGEGWAMRARLVRCHGASLGETAGMLRRAASQQPLPARAFARLAFDLGELHAAAIARCAGGDQLDLAAVHGQTIVHEPPLSWQLINPAPIAARLRCPVICDLRQADLAAGGQGAPITPAADWILFRSARRSRAIVNLGGFCNVTLLPATDDVSRLEEVRGFDLCACNQVLDAVARRVLGQSMDAGGAAAGRGQIDAGAASSLRAALDQQASAGRSLGTGDELEGWVQSVTRMRPEDVAASATAAVGRCIAERLGRSGAEEIILAGGGVHNRALVEAISRAMDVPVIGCDQLDVPVQAREALCIAVLGALCADGVPITLPQVTGCTEAPASGTWSGDRTAARCGAGSAG